MPPSERKPPARDRWLLVEETGEIWLLKREEARTPWSGSLRVKGFATNFLSCMRAVVVGGPSGHAARHSCGEMDDLPARGFVATARGADLVAGVPFARKLDHERRLYRDIYGPSATFTGEVRLATGRRGAEGLIRRRRPCLDARFRVASVPTRRPHERRDDRDRNRPHHAVGAQISGAPRGDHR